MPRTKMTEKDKMAASLTAHGQAGKTLFGEKKARKKRRVKHVKRDIKKYRMGKLATKTLIPYEAVKRLVKEVVNQVSGEGAKGMRIQRAAIEALQQAGEAAIVKIMEEANAISVVAGKRQSVLLNDFRLAVELANKHVLPK